MYGGVVPYSELPGGRLAKISAMTNLDYPIQLDQLSDPMVMETLQMCLEKDPIKRATIDQLLSHNFLKLPFNNNVG
jgi:serine/threonine protein kinase